MRLEEIPITKVLEGAKSKKDDWARFEITALEDLHGLGIRTLAEAIVYTGENKYHAWMAESIVWVIRYVRDRRYAEALRGTWQLHEYAARLGKWPNPLFLEASVSFRELFEELLTR